MACAEKGTDLKRHNVAAVRDQPNAVPLNMVSAGVHDGNLNFLRWGAVSVDTCRQ